MRKFFQKASRLAQVLLASSISFLPAQQIDFELSSGENIKTEQEIVLRRCENGEEVEKNTAIFNAGLNSQGNEFTFEYHTKDYDRQDWNGTDKEKTTPFSRHTSLSTDTKILIKHPNSVVVGKSEQKFFVVPEYQWEDAIPFEEHKPTGLENFLNSSLNNFGEFAFQNQYIKTSEIIFSLTPEGADRFNELKEIDSIFPNLIIDSVDRIPIRFGKKVSSIYTAHSVSVPFNQSISESDEIIFFIEPVFGNSDYSAKTSPLKIGLTSRKPVRVPVEKISPSEITDDISKEVSQNILPTAKEKTLEWYVPTKAEREGLISYGERFFHRIPISSKNYHSEIFVINPVDEKESRAEFYFSALNLQNDALLKDFFMRLYKRDTFPFFISNGTFFIIPEWERNALNFRQEGVVLEFLNKYINRVGGEVIPPSFLAERIKDRVELIFPRAKISPEDISEIAKKNLELQLKYYRAGEEKAQQMIRKQLRDFSNNSFFNTFSKLELESSMNQLNRIYIQEMGLQFQEECSTGSK